MGGGGAERDHFVSLFVRLRILQHAHGTLLQVGLLGSAQELEVLLTFPFLQQEVLKRSVVSGGDETAIPCTTNHLQNPTVPTNQSP